MQFHPLGIRIDLLILSNSLFFPETEIQRNQLNISYADASLFFVYFFAIFSRRGKYSKLGKIHSFKKVWPAILCTELFSVNSNVIYHNVTDDAFLLHSKPQCRPNTSLLKQCPAGNWNWEMGIQKCAKHSSGHFFAMFEFQKWNSLFS